MAALTADKRVNLCGMVYHFSGGGGSSWKLELALFFLFLLSFSKGCDNQDDNNERYKD